MVQDENWSINGTRVNKNLLFLDWLVPSKALTRKISFKITLSNTYIDRPEQNLNLNPSSSPAQPSQLPRDLQLTPTHKSCKLEAWRTNEVNLVCRKNIRLFHGQPKNATKHGFACQNNSNKTGWFSPDSCRIALYGVEKNTINRRMLSQKGSNVLWNLQLGGGMSPYYWFHTPWTTTVCWQML